MKLVTYQKNTEQRLGLLHAENIYDMAACAELLDLNLPSTMLPFLQLEEKGMFIAQKVHDAIDRNSLNHPVFMPVKDTRLLAPIPNPPSCRDAYAFRQHVATARRNRGLEMVPEFDQFPIFYFTNHRAIFGEGDIPLETDHLLRLDFELEVAIVIGKHGRNIPAAEADSYIAGFTIMNDLSARQLQMEEMKLNLGPAKGKDFATVIGPWLVTPDELDFARKDKPEGSQYMLQMQAFHNGKKVSDGNMRHMNWTFAEIIERVSYGADIYPGDVIGSGTVGTGCYLELNGTWALQAKKQGETHTPVWLNDGDRIVLTVEGLGTLDNRIALNPNSPSILAVKKNIR